MIIVLLNASYMIPVTFAKVNVGGESKNKNDTSTLKGAMATDPISFEAAFQGMILIEIV